MVNTYEVSIFIDKNSSILVATCLLMVLDVLTGLLKAFYTHSYDSSKMRDGLYHKMGFLSMIVLSMICEIFIEGPQLDVQFTIPACSVVCAYIMLCEFGSVVENLSQVNPNLAQLTSRYLVKVDEPNQVE